MMQIIRSSFCASIRTGTSRRHKQVRSIYRPCQWRQFSANPQALGACQMINSGYVCAIPVEPLHCYRRGGYHPVLIGDVFHGGRYRILQKLGWGSYSTVWFARDEMFDSPIAQTNVAVKVTVAERSPRHELSVMEAITAASSTHPGSKHLPQLLDHFEMEGPNGIHHCTVYELTGPSIPIVLETSFADTRLPGLVATRIAKQTLQALDCLHSLGIAHGDLHTGNLVLAVPSVRTLPLASVLRVLGEPDAAAVVRKDGGPLEPGIPRYLVRPAYYYPADLSLSTCSINLIDFGETYFDANPPMEVRTPLVVRAPEAIFKDRLDHRADMWSMGCALFELISGQPPFDSLLIKPPTLIRQMLGTIREELPARWRSTWKSMAPIEPSAEAHEELGLQQWLEEVYFDCDLERSFSKDDITQLGDLIRRMLRLEPAARASAKQIMEAPFFRAVA